MMTPKQRMGIERAVAVFGVTNSFASQPDLLLRQTTLTSDPPTGWAFVVEFETGAVCIEIDPDANVDLLKLTLWLRDLRRAVSSAIACDAPEPAAAAFGSDR